MKKLMILSTGGTIACTQTDEGLIPTLSADDILAYAPEAKKLGEIETKTIFNLDSSNIQPEEWHLIAKAIYDCLPDYDGIVVLHGTDTMAYTASMLSFMLKNVNKPVVITGSQLPVGHPQTDARKNLGHALITGATGGVFVAFDKKIISAAARRRCARRAGTRLRKTSTALAAGFAQDAQWIAPLEAFRARLRWTMRSSSQCIFARFRFPNASGGV
ncbi:MAG: asparaginase domain-containing protein [Eubacteriales bacterium]